MSMIGKFLVRWLCVISIVTSHLSYADDSNETMLELEKDVTGGIDADISYYGKFAFVIGTLLYEEEVKKFYPIHNCGASMIQRYSPILLLTAAHCVKPIKGPGGGWTDSTNTNEYWAFRGWTGPAGNVQFRFGDFRAYRIEEVYFPEAWRKSNQPIFADVAILRLDSGESGRHFYNIPIATPGWVTAMRNSLYMVNPDSNKQSMRLEITGWGKEGSDGDYARTVKSGSVWYLSRGLCNKMIAGYKRYMDIGGSQSWFKSWVTSILKKYNEDEPTDGNLLQELSTYLFNIFRPSKTDWVFKDEICAIDIKKGEVNTCYGDSGGPLAHHSPLSLTYTLLGVTSSSIVGDCEPKLPVMYSSLNYYSDWIKSIHACIMIEKLDEWKNVDETDEYNHWTKQAKFWHNEGKTGCVPDMVWRANRNRATEPKFKKWYVNYMTVQNNYLSNMQKWCNLRDDIEALYEGTNPNAIDTLEKPGFFPMMIEFSEWPEQTREEKYRRAWGKPTIIYEGYTSLFTRHGTYVVIEDNMSVSLDLIRGNNHETNFNARILQVYEIMMLRFTNSRLELLVGPTYEFFCSIPWASSDKLRFIHIEVVFNYIQDRVQMSYRGSWSCNAIRAWRPSGGVLVAKNLEFGQSGVNHQNGDPMARNIEFRTWTDPPTCCDRYNKGDGKCMTNCDQAKTYSPKVCTG